ncbi:hypothetical protein FH969_00210 [Miniimonas arenae]|uniref:Uncharacterized protein n=1 Tax=Miniimonas arenae TaxID=676201 RepID=A0A5C5BG28_9MICO|nr:MULTISPECIES: hypothetical protein [Miniimonas]TNU77240.1 hypothetical protein FH969_00210 [Miniimonas arenae]
MTATADLPALLDPAALRRGAAVTTAVNRYASATPAPMVVASDTLWTAVPPRWQRGMGRFRVTPRAADTAPVPPGGGVGVLVLRSVGRPVDVEELERVLAQYPPYGPDNPPPIFRLPLDPDRSRPLGCATREPGIRFELVPLSRPLIAYQAARTVVDRGTAAARRQPAERARRAGDAEAARRELLAALGSDGRGDVEIRLTVAEAEELTRRLAG